MEKTIEELLSYFTTTKRGDETITILKDGAPEYLLESIYKSHGDRLPDDWIYDKYESILSTLNGYSIESLEDVDNYRSEIVDGLVDIYNTDRTAWLVSHLDNAFYCDDAVKEYGSEDADMFTRIGLGQYMMIDEIYSEIYRLLEELQEDNTQ